MNPNDPLTLQRLIDDECNESEIRLLLVNATGHPEHWQDIATAFIEDQLWQRQFQNENRDLTTSPLRNETGEAETPTKSSGQPKSTDWSRYLDRIQWLAMAACLVLAGMTGYFIGQDNYPSLNRSSELVAENPLSNGNSSVNNELAQTPRITPASLKADYHLQLVDDQGTPQGSILDGEIPLYAVNSREQLNQIRQPEEDPFQVSPEVLRQLAGQGFQVRQNVDYISGNLKDGRAFVVPVRTINFLPGQ